jgi:hypothetical protein
VSNIFEKYLKIRGKYMKTPIYKRLWFWAIVVVVIIIGAVNQGDDESLTQPSATESATVTASATATSSESPTNEEAVDMSAEEPDKKLMVISDVFEVIGKTEQEVIEHVGKPEEVQESEFRPAGSDTKVPAKTLIYSEFGDYEYYLVDGKVQRYTYTVSPESGWKFEDKSLHDLMFSMGLKDAKLIEKNEMVAVYKHDKLFDVRVFSDGDKVSYLYIIADEKYK